MEECKVCSSSQFLTSLVQPAKLPLEELLTEKPERTLNKTLRRSMDLPIVMEQATTWLQLVVVEALEEAVAAENLEGVEAEEEHLQFLLEQEQQVRSIADSHNKGTDTIVNLVIISPRSAEHLLDSAISLKLILIVRMMVNSHLALGSRCQSAATIKR